MRTIASPLRFFILFFSNFLQAYILPVARTWQAHTSPNPPLPKTRYIRKVLYVTGWLWGGGRKKVDQKTVNRKCVCVCVSMCHWCVPFEPFPLEVTVKVHRVLEILERLTGQIIADDGRAGSKHVLAAFVQPFFALPYNVVIDDFDRFFSTWSQESPVDFLGSFLSSYILQLEKNKFN
jgi:hypothetical protein